jgi:glycosyltransferase involved in cell wall biosynthesis
MLTKGNPRVPIESELDEGADTRAITSEGEGLVRGVPGRPLEFRRSRSNRFGVAVVDFTENYGGAFEIALNLVKYVNEIEPGSAALVSSQPAEYLDDRVGGAFPTLNLRMTNATFAQGNVVRLAWNAGRNLLRRELPGACRLARFLREFGATVVHLNNGMTSQLYGALASRMTGAACIASYRGYAYPSRYIKPYRPLVHRYIVCSQAVKSHLVNVLGIPEGKLAYIYDPVDTDIFHPNVPPADLERLFGIPRGRKVFAIFGRLVRWKGHPVFLRAARLVLDAVPDAHAMIVGNLTDLGPAYAEELRALTRELGITDRVTFAGYRSDIAPLMRACEVLVHASTTPEPFGTVVLEGMACGRPYVAMEEGGPAEMIESGTHGLLVPASEPEAMARAIITILTEPATAAAFGAAARARCVERFSAPIIARRHLELYQEVALLKRARRQLGSPDR